nr:hypothetical protein DM860_008285 [Ipomoea batatas]
MDEKSDGLEIVSIGKLYSGPWDKKYWSSSRGKDRYPYPVGYKALRNQNGVTYKMEILEGLNGPLFMISSTDGQSTSGQTPDIAWEFFQKKGCPRIKSLPGKRFSCKIDGVEVFGFKNPFVQRLLRELVSDINEAAEKLSPRSNFSNSVALQTNNQSQCIVSSADPNLLLHLKKPQTTGKRSRREKIMSVNSYRNTGLKKHRHQDKNDNLDASHSTGKRHEPRNSLKVLPGSVGLESVVQKEENQVSEENVSHVAPSNTNDHPKVNGLFSQDENKSSSFESQLPLEEVGILPKDGKPSDRSEVFKVEVLSNSFIKENNEEKQVTNGLCLTNDANLYAHDTLDDPTADSLNFNSTNVKDEISAPDTVIPNVLRADSHTNELGIPSSNVSSAKSEFETFDQEVAKSMMTVLLPRALPLLKTFSRRKVNSVKPPEKSTCMSQEENKTDHAAVTCVSKLSQNSDLEMKEKIEFPDRSHASVLPCSGHAEFIIPDSFDNDEGGYVPDTELPQSCEIVEAEQSSPDLYTRLCETKLVPDIVDSEENSLVSHDFQMDLCKNSKEDMRRSGTSMACRKAYVPASTEKVPNTINGCGFVSSETLSAEPVLECVHLSESIICREFRDDCAAEEGAKANPSNAIHLSQGNDHDQRNVVERNFCGNEQKIDGSPLCSHNEDRVASTNGVLHDVAPTLQNQENSRILDGIHNSDAPPTNSCQEISKYNAPGEQNFVTSPLSYMQNQRMDTYDGMNEEKHDNDDSNFINHMDIEHNKSKIKGVFKFVACYVHPMPVSLVLVTTMEREISICVLCGPFLQKERKLFIYKAPMVGQDEGNPSFVGYASLMLPFDRDIDLDSTALQFSPNGQYLVLLNSIKVPCCREGDIYCPCLACTSDLEDNAVKILQIKDGYTSVIARLQSTESVRCILVCRPHHLLAADDSGKLNIWFMNSRWSKSTEEFFVQSPSCIPPLMELKRIPNFLHLVLGLYGFGELILWDIEKRVLVSKFSSHTSVFGCVPLSLFTWKAKCNISVDLCTDEIMEVTKASFSEKGDNQVLSYTKGDEVVAWLLVSTAPDLDKHRHQSSEQSDPLRSWRLALLVKNTLIMGDVLESRAAVVGASVGRGIIGRSDGQVYMWDLITGTKLGSLHHFKDASVSSIATDDSEAGALAIASDGGELLLYLPT